MNIKKSVLLSKTFWFNLVMAVSPLFPGVGEFLTGNAQVVAVFWSVVNMGLRLVSKKEIKLLP